VRPSWRNVPGASRIGGIIVERVPELRPMRDDDVAAVNELSVRAFEDYARRLGEPPPVPPPFAAAHLRLRHLLATDPGGCWVADDGAIAGAAIALVREGIWGLSLLVVDPGLQSAGIGGALLERALVHGDGARGGIILASADHRALRAYSRAGFALHPTVKATGAPRGVAADPAVRPFTAGDHPMAAAVDRAVRGAAHGADLDALAAAGCQLLAYPGRGYVASRGGDVKTLAAADEEAAAALLRTVLATTPNAEVEWITARQQWAVAVALDAGLELRPQSAVFLRGDVGPFTPYIPGGAYL
jgi:GNAT superfamily N-acetyltransferase